MDRTFFAQYEKYLKLQNTTGDTSQELSVLNKAYIEHFTTKLFCNLLTEMLAFILVYLMLN